MNKYIHNNIIAFLSFILLSLVFTACNADEIEVPGYVTEGEDAKISLKIDLEDISIKSRADMSADLENKVECLWVAIYNVKTGKRTFSNSYTPDGNFPESTSGELKDIDTKSGNSYIVAVANYDNATAIDINYKTESKLETLLANADTWDKYRAIAIKQHLDGNKIRIEVPAEAIVMQGSYRGTAHTDNYREDESVETVAIQPGVNNLNGKIHLRRIWTQNKFTIKPSDNIISMELVDVEVLNVPAITWLHGRSQGDDASAQNILSYANAGDAYQPEADVKHEMYGESPTYTPTSMTVTTDANGRPNYVFDYWQFENKRTSDYITNNEDLNYNDDKYALREEEYKDPASKENTGIYKSLCGESGDVTLDNNATYIRFTARIRYIVDDIPSPDLTTGQIDKPKYRNAEATYVVHLGYIGNDATDFNCYRNSKYTYNITVKSVDNILLEAYKEGENQPGAEGSVTDVTDEFFNLDAHFNVFNIYLTKQELEGFTFSMTTYEDDIPHTITNITDASLGMTNNVPADKNDANWKYYNWIQLVENEGWDVTNPNIIAKFPDLTKGEGNKVLYLNDIKNEAAKLNNATDGICFTVYVKEYTYEADYGDDDPNYGNESVNKEWIHYVNQPSRTANFNVAYRVSEDKESQHFKAKYALSQRSIQTYYDIAAAASGNGTALGIEHVNEVFGMNLRWTIPVPDDNDVHKGYDPDNGRYNVWHALGGVNNGTRATDTWEAANVLNLEALLNVNSVNNTNQTGYAKHMNFDGGTKYVPAMKTITSGLSGTTGYYNSRASSYDPQTDDDTAQYIQAIFSCMNRNKDENGNGQIDAPELKWYVPASGKYLRVILGRNNLVTPLMNYEQETLPQGCADDYNTLYHFISSDRKIIWADEGMSSSRFWEAKRWSHAPWQVRCIRNLGTDLTSVSTGNKVTPAYDDKDIDTTTKGGVIKPTRYFGGALRNPTTSQLPIHKTSDPYNRLALYGFEIAPAGNDNTTTYTREAGLYAITYNDAGTTVTGLSEIETNYDAIKNAIETASPCEKLNKHSGRTGWRIPNQKEIVIMMRAGVINNNTGYYSYSINGWTGNLSTTNHDWDDTMGMMSCTQEHWPSMSATDFETTNGNPINGSDALSGRNRWCTIEPSSLLATAKKHSVILGVRCVRDLTAAEANMTYEQIKNYKTN